MFDWLRRLLGIRSVPRVATDTSPGKLYSLMRHEAFRRQRSDCGPQPPPAFSTPAFGILMEIGYPGITVTLSAFAGGGTSLYVSSAYRIVGGDSYENVQEANTNFIETANHLLEHFEPRESVPIPETWHITFYALTDNGILGADIPAANLKDGHVLTPLFQRGREVLEQLSVVARMQETEQLLEVISAYDSAIAARPADAKLYCARGEAFAQLQQFDKAVADYGRAISLKPNDPNYVMGRGHFYAAMGDLTSALADFDRVIAMDPKDAMAYSNRGAAYSKTGNVERAIEEYGVAIEVDPRYPNSYANRAYAYYKLGEYEKGIDDCNKALALRPDHANTYNNRGHCRAALGDVHGASHDFQMALRLAECSREATEEALEGLQGLARNAVA